MKNIGTKTIETERLILRRFKIEDSEAMFKNWASDPEVTKFLTWKVHQNVEQTKGLLDFWIKSYDSDNCYKWAIELKERNDVIGSIDAVNVDTYIEKVHMGYCIGRNWWGKGIMTEALTALIDFFFREVEVNKVEARHNVKNPASGKVMKKSGMVYEGTLRQFDRCNDGICDAVYYGILQSEWEEKMRLV